jgi:nicotinamide-nucleotide adenylyltransferase
MNALFIGRFQPFHIGHLKVLQNTSIKYDEIIIGIGSSQYSHNRNNPFTADERKIMVEMSLKKVGISNFKIILIPDIHNPPKWVDHVLSIFTDFDIVITNNKLTKSLFSEKGYSVEKTPLYDKKHYSGKEIRRRMIAGERWAHLVPEEVVNVIKEINGEQRVIDVK